MQTLEKEFEMNVELHKLAVLSVFYQNHYKSFVNMPALWIEDVARKEAKSLYKRDRAEFNRQYNWAWECMKDNLI